MEREFVAEVIEWRGPAPFYFAKLPDEEADVFKQLAPMISYGWGCIACEATIRDIEVKTALMPREGGYLLPLKNAVRIPGEIELGEMVLVRLKV